MELASEWPSIGRKFPWREDARGGGHRSTNDRRRQQHALFPAAQFDMCSELETVRVEHVFLQVLTVMGIQGESEFYIAT